MIDRKHIAIIGGGSAGLVALKTLKESPAYTTKRWKITIFESRDNIGGVWLPDTNSDSPEFPQTPLYNSLTTNLPHPIMAFRDFSFPPSTPLYPHANIVQQYLEDYADAHNLRQHIRLSTSVKCVLPERSNGKHVWKVVSSRLPTEEETTEYFDTLIIANGRNGYPVLPSNIPRLSEWIAQGKASHSKSYREPSTYHDMNIVVVGNGPSALDIAPELVGVAKHVYRSVRNARETNSDAHDRPATDLSNMQAARDVQLCSAIRSLGSPEDGSVGLVDGTTLTGVDHILFATGYETCFPFLDVPVLNGTPERETAIPDESQWTLNSGQHLFPLSLHMLPTSSDLPLGSLFFLGLPRPVVPFPLVEGQCQVIEAILSGTLSLNLHEQDRSARTAMEALLKRVGGSEALAAREWHKLPDALQFDYRVELARLARRDSQLMVPDWQRCIYEKKRELRAAWKELERTGKDKDIVQDVGTKGEQEWVELMNRILEGSQTSVQGILEDEKI